MSKSNGISGFSAAVANVSWARLYVIGTKECQDIDLNSFAGGTCFSERLDWVQAQTFNEQIDLRWHLAADVEQCCECINTFTV